MVEKQLACIDMIWKNYVTVTLCILPATVSFHCHVKQYELGTLAVHLLNGLLFWYSQKGPLTQTFLVYHNVTGHPLRPVSCCSVFRNPWCRLYTFVSNAGPLLYSQITSKSGPMSIFLVQIISFTVFSVHAHSLWDLTKAGYQLRSLPCQRFAGGWQL